MKKEKNLVNLTWLKFQSQASGFDFNLMLDDDIIQNNLLLLTKGTKLNKDLLEKLLKFGVIEAPINFLPICKNQDITDFISPDLLKNQNALVLHNDLKEIAKIINILAKAGFTDDNVYATMDSSILNKYLKKKNIFYIFIHHSMFSQELAECILLSTNNKFINIFVLGAGSLNEIKELKEITFNSDYMNVKILQKPLDSGYIKALINMCPSSKFKQLLEKSDNIGA